MVKVNAWNPKTEKIEATGYFASTKEARKDFNNFLVGYYRLYNDANGVWKKAYFK